MTGWISAPRARVAARSFCVDPVAGGNSMRIAMPTRCASPILAIAAIDTRLLLCAVAETL